MNKYATVLVTGGAGYIGRHVVKALMAAGHFPVVMDNSLAPYAQRVPGCVCVSGRIEDKKLLSSLFTQYDFDAVMHLAAYPEAMESVIDPIKYHQNNFSGTMVLVESMLNYGIRRLIFSSSAAVYGESQYTPMDEDHPCQPNTRHGESKHFVEKVLHDCSLTHGLRYIALRHYSVVGYNALRTAAMLNCRNSDIITNMLNAAIGKTLIFNIFGTDYATPDGTCIRDYVHVDDVAGAYIAALLSLMNGGRSDVYNIGTGHGHSVKELLARVQSVTGRPIPTAPVARRHGDAATLIADAGKIRSELGWKPKLADLDSIIQATWSWHQESPMLN